MRKHDECARARRRHRAAPPLPAVDFVAVRARAAVHSAAAVAPTSAAPVLRLAAAAVLLLPAARASLSRACGARLACSSPPPPLSPNQVPLGPRARRTDLVGPTSSKLVNQPCNEPGYDPA